MSWHGFGPPGNVFCLDETPISTLLDILERLLDPVIQSGIRDTGGHQALAIFECNKPVIAAINGAAVGIGATMTCAMDIRLTSDSARIGFVFNKIGITPEACSTWFLPRIVGMSRALGWSYTGEILSAEKAVTGGFLKAAVPVSQLLKEAYALARSITAHSPVAMALTRQMMYRNAAFSHPLEADRIDPSVLSYCSQGSGKEGVQAFLAKRPPQFIDRVSVEMPPFTLTRSWFQASSRLTAMAWAANASLTSMSCSWSRVQPARLRQRRVADTGPIPI